jgi:peptidyl-prolyl cis-trans isomerase C
MGLIINGQRVDDGLLGAEFAGIKSFHERQGNVSCCERDGEFRESAKQNVIARVLLTQEAMNSTPAPLAEEIEAAFEKLKEEHGGEKRFYVNIGATAEQADQIRNDISINLRVEKMIDGLCVGIVAGEEELADFYQKNISAFMSPEEVRASHISKSPPRVEAREEVFGLFREIRKELLAGADFEEMARKHSDRGQDLIDLGFFARGQLPEEFELVAFSMNVGEVSPVFASGVGYHIVKVTGHRAAAAKAFDEVREDVKKLWMLQRRQERMKALVGELQQRAKIEEVDSEVSETSEVVGM